MITFFLFSEQGSGSWLQMKMKATSKMLATHYARYLAGEEWISSTPVVATQQKWMWIHQSCCGVAILNSEPLKGNQKSWFSTETDYLLSLLHMSHRPVVRPGPLHTMVDMMQHNCQGVSVYFLIVNTGMAVDVRVNRLSLALPMYTIC